MNSILQFDFQVNKDNNTIVIKREFAADKGTVWSAWTTAEILDQWWAPKPYKNQTKSMDCRSGGTWLYCMISPENHAHWCRFDYNEVVPYDYYNGKDAFCDEDGNVNPHMPSNHWHNKFLTKGEHTLVDMLLSFDTFDDLERIIKMGFKEGFTMGLENLDQYLSGQMLLRKQNKQNYAPRVSTYLNFPGNAEEAFLFYKNVFRSNFINGIKRFGDIPQDPSQPPLADNVKNMVLHIELPILDGHILMGTDAPKEFGMTVNAGNNMYINLEPDSRDEAKRLFDSLSEGGRIKMPIQDMFWGAYYGSLTDKYGINWMINFQNPA